MAQVELILNIVILIIVSYLLIQKRDQLKKPSIKPGKKIILDSCALIDGRIVDLSNSGFIPEELIVPNFVINELQLLADGSDSHKRERARYGLDVIKALQSSTYAQVTIDDSIEEKRVPTDDKLIELAKKLNTPLYTTDFNLNKVASIQGVRVLNVNELAQQLRPAILPGEFKKVKVLQKGNNPNQGVGYLDDGTMVVVEDASRSIGKVLDVEIDRTFQTVAGKMVFAHKRLN